MSLIQEHRKNIGADFVDLKRVASLVDAAVKMEPRKIPGTPCLIDEAKLQMWLPALRAGSTLIGICTRMGGLSIGFFL